MKFWHLLHHDEPWKLYTKWNKPDTEGQIFYDKWGTQQLSQIYAERMVVTGIWKGRNTVEQVESFGLEWWKSLEDG